VAAALAQARQDPRPSMTACRTFIGSGVPRIRNRRRTHGGRITREDTGAAG